MDRTVEIIQACSSLGVHVQGAELGPGAIVRALGEKGLPLTPLFAAAPADTAPPKGTDVAALNAFNEKLYAAVQAALIKGRFPLVLGGDHAISIASALASAAHHGEMGMIWVDSHADYNDFSTTLTGNLHGMPFACATGCGSTRLRPFHTGRCINPRRCVLLGARDIDLPMEMDNLQRAGVHVLTTEQVQRMGMEAAVKEALAIAGDGTAGVHLSFDLDVIDPRFAPGVSVPAAGGLLPCEAVELARAFGRCGRVLSMDLVEYNPLYDAKQRTLLLALEVLRGALGLAAQSEEG